MKERYFFCVVQQYSGTEIRTISKCYVLGNFPTPQKVLFEMDIKDDGNSVVVCISEMKKADYDIFVSLFKA